MIKKNKGKYKFTLHGLNIEKIRNLYGLEIKNIQSDKDNFLPNTTKLSELNTEKDTPSVISFLDETKRLHSCQVSMIDFKSSMNVNFLRYSCFWCRHTFDTHPIGCPINYISKKATKKYHSHITCSIYTINENITKNRKISSDNITVNPLEYYETDGVFCSFNCCLSWIMDNKHNRLYDYSSMLLMKMYNEFMGTKSVVINPSPHWRLLQPYGGHLTIVKFRENLNNVEYKYHGITKKLPDFISQIILYEEKIKF